MGHRPWHRPYWLAFDRYVARHDSHVRRFEALGFVASDDCSFIYMGLTRAEARGRIKCVNGIFIDVHQRFARNRYNEVSGLECKYQACIDTPHGIRQIFRYDNAEAKLREGHADAYHKHVHDLKSPDGEDILLEWIGADNWPTLGDVLRELSEWWEETGQHEFTDQ